MLLNPLLTSRRGFTIADCLVASALFGLCAVAFLTGLGFASRIIDQNARVLVADGLAWDAAWRLFNRDYGRIGDGSDEFAFVEDVPRYAAPELHIPDYPAQLLVRIGVDSAAEARRGEGDDVIDVPMKTIEVDVEWGPPDQRVRLSEFGSHVVLRRSSLTRVKRAEP